MRAPRLILKHSFPQDWMRNTEIAADQENEVGLFEVAIRERRRIEAERFLVGGRGRRHALPCVAVSVQNAHAEFGQCTEEGEFLGDDLSCAQPGQRFGAVAFLNVFEARTKFNQRAVPGHRFKFTRGIAQQRLRRAVVGFQHGQRFPAFGAGCAAVDRIFFGGRKPDGHAVFKMDVQSAAGGTVTADRLRGGVGLDAFGQAAQAEAGRVQNHFMSEMAFALAD